MAGNFLGDGLDNPWADTSSAATPAIPASGSQPIALEPAEAVRPQPPAQSYMDDDEDVSVNPFVDSAPAQPELSVPSPTFPAHAPSASASSSAAVANDANPTTDEDEFGGWLSEGPPSNLFNNASLAEKTDKGKQPATAAPSSLPSSCHPVQSAGPSLYDIGNALTDTGWKPDADDFQPPSVLLPRVPGKIVLDPKGEWGASVSTQATQQPTPQEAQQPSSDEPEPDLTQPSDEKPAAGDGLNFWGFYPFGRSPKKQANKPPTQSTLAGLSTLTGYLAKQVSHQVEGAVVKPVTDKLVATAQSHQWIDKLPAYNMPILADASGGAPTDQTPIAQGQILSFDKMNVAQNLDTAPFALSKGLLAQVVLHWIEPEKKISKLTEADLPALLVSIQEALMVPRFKRQGVDVNVFRKIVKRALHPNTPIEGTEIDGITRELAPEILLEHILKFCGAIKRENTPEFMQIIRTLTGMNDDTPHSIDVYLTTLCRLAVAAPNPKSLLYPGTAFPPATYHPDIDKVLGLENGRAKEMSRRTLLAHCIKTLMQFDPKEIAACNGGQNHSQLLVLTDAHALEFVLEMLDWVMTPHPTQKENEKPAIMQTIQQYFQVEINKNFVTDLSDKIYQKKEAVEQITQIVKELNGKKQDIESRGKDLDQNLTAAWQHQSQLEKEKAALSGQSASTMSSFSLQTQSPAASQPFFDPYGGEDADWGNVVVAAPSVTSSVAPTPQQSEVQSKAIAERLEELQKEIGVSTKKVEAWREKLEANEREVAEVSAQIIEQQSAIQKLSDEQEALKQKGKEAAARIAESENKAFSKDLKALCLVLREYTHLSSNPIDLDMVVPIEHILRLMDVVTSLATITPKELLSWTASQLPFIPFDKLVQLLDAVKSIAVQVNDNQTPPDITVAIARKLLRLTKSTLMQLFNALGSCDVKTRSFSNPAYVQKGTSLAVVLDHLDNLSRVANTWNVSKLQDEVSSSFSLLMLLMCGLTEKGNDGSLPRNRHLANLVEGWRLTYPGMCIANSGWNSTVEAGLGALDPKSDKKPNIAMMVTFMLQAYFSAVMHAIDAGLTPITENNFQTSLTKVAAHTLEPSRAVPASPSTEFSSGVIIDLMRGAGAVTPVTPVVQLAVVPVAFQPVFVSNRINFKGAAQKEETYGQYLMRHVKDKSLIGWLAQDKLGVFSGLKIEDLSDTMQKKSHYKKSRLGEAEHFTDAICRLTVETLAKASVVIDERTISDLEALATFLFKRGDLDCSPLQWINQCLHLSQKTSNTDNEAFNRAKMAFNHDLGFDFCFKPGLLNDAAVLTAFKTKLQVTQFFKSAFADAMRSFFRGLIKTLNDKLDEPHSFIPHLAHQVAKGELQPEVALLFARFDNYGNVRGVLSGFLLNQPREETRPVTEWLALYLMVMVTQVHAVAKRAYELKLRQQENTAAPDVKKLTVNFLTNLAATQEAQERTKEKAKATQQERAQSDKTPSQRAAEKNAPKSWAETFGLGLAPPPPKASMAIDFVKSETFIAEMREIADRLFAENIQALMDHYGRPPSQNAAQKSQIEKYYGDGRYHLLHEFNCYLITHQDEENVFEGFKAHLASDAFKKKYPFVDISYKDAETLQLALRAAFQEFLKSHAPAVTYSATGSGLQAIADKPPMISLVLDLPLAVEAVTPDTFFAGQDGRVEMTTAAVKHPVDVLKKMFLRLSPSNINAAAKKGLDSSDWQAIQAEKRLLDDVLALMLTFDDDNHPVALNFAINAPAAHPRKLVSSLVHNIFTVETEAANLRITVVNLIRKRYRSSLIRSNDAASVLTVMDQEPGLLRMGTLPDLLGEVSAEFALLAFFSIGKHLTDAAYLQVIHPQAAQPEPVDSKVRLIPSKGEFSTDSGHVALRAFYHCHLQPIMFSDLPEQALYSAFGVALISANVDGAPLRKNGTHSGTVVTVAEAFFSNLSLQHAISSSGLGDLRKQIAEGETQVSSDQSVDLKYEEHGAWKRLYHLIANWVHDKKILRAQKQRASSSSASAAVDPDRAPHLHATMAYGQVAAKAAAEAEKQRLDNLLREQVGGATPFSTASDKTDDAPPLVDQLAAQRQQVAAAAMEAAEVEAVSPPPVVVRAVALAATIQNFSQSKHQQPSWVEEVVAREWIDTEKQNKVAISQPTSGGTTNAVFDVASTVAPVTIQTAAQRRETGDSFSRKVDVEKSKGDEPSRSRNLLKSIFYAAVGISAAFGIGMALGAFVPTAAAAGTTTLGLAIFGGIAGITGIGAAAATGGILAGVVLLAVGIALIVSAAISHRKAVALAAFEAGPQAAIMVSERRRDDPLPPPALGFTAANDAGLNGHSVSGAGAEVGHGAGDPTRKAPPRAGGLEQLVLLPEP